MEERHPVIEGAEAFYYQGNEIGILISHGFVGTPQSVRYIGKRLHEYGYSVLAPRLPGHGTDSYDLEKATYEDWFRELERAYQLLTKKCSAVFVVGQSMGGTLTLRLAHKYPQIKGIATINAALSLPSLEHLKGQNGPRFILEGDPDIKAKGVNEITYPKVPLKAIHQLQFLMEDTPTFIPEVVPPILCVKSAVDHVVPPESTDFIYNRIGSRSKELVTLNNSFHVASMDNDKERIVSELGHFIEKHVSKPLVASF